MRHDDAETKRDEELRRAMLDALDLARQHAPTGQLSGPLLKRRAEAGRAFDDGFVDEAHALRMARDLVAFGLVEETVGTIRRPERLALEHVSYRLSSKGVQLCLEQIPPVAGVWDERI